jgi:hypothetical protein
MAWTSHFRHQNPQLRTPLHRHRQQNDEGTDTDTSSDSFQEDLGQSQYQGMPEHAIAEQVFFQYRRAKRFVETIQKKTRSEISQVLQEAQFKVWVIPVLGADELHVERKLREIVRKRLWQETESKRQKRQYSQMSRCGSERAFSRQKLSEEGQSSFLRVQALLAAQVVHDIPLSLRMKNRESRLFPLGLTMTSTQSPEHFVTTSWGKMLQSIFILR